MFGIIQSLSIIKAKIVAGTVRGLKLLIPTMLDCLPHNQDEDKQFFGEDFLFHSGYLYAKQVQWAHQY